MARWNLGSNPYFDGGYANNIYGGFVVKNHIGKVLVRRLYMENLTLYNKSEKESSDGIYELHRDVFLL